MDFKPGGRLCVPFVIESLFYSGISLAKDIHHGKSIHWLGYVYRFVVGKSATPFYYVVVLIQLTVITPWLVHVVKESRTIKNLLWLITPCYLLYIYVWNFSMGSSPRLYETLFPAWFGFYYLGINIRCGLKLKCSGWKVLIAWVISCVEALALRKLGMSVGFYVKDGIVTSCSRTGGKGGWQLYSISRWTAEDGRKLKHFLEVEFKEKQNRQIYWDDVAMFCHPDDFKLGIRPMNASDIIEVDNLSELIALDESYKKYAEEN